MERKYAIVWYNGNEYRINEGVGNSMADAVMNAGLQDAAEQCDIMAVVQVPVSTEFASLGPVEYCGGEFPLALLDDLK